MNPFEMSVTAFLALYVPFGAAVFAAMYWVSRRSEPALQVGQVPTDPCTVACLRHGPAEAVRVAALALLERGALELTAQDNLATTPRGAAAAADVSCRVRRVRAFQPRR
jgi:hypothetical protein